MLWIPHQLVGAPLYYNVTLECFTEAHPTSLNYWTRDDGHMIHESPKYHMENTVGIPAYKTHMRLLIRNINTEDYGTYKCIAKNPRGESDGTIRLYSKYKTPWLLLTTCIYNSDLLVNEYVHLNKLIYYIYFGVASSPPTTTPDPRALTVPPPSRPPRRDTPLTDKGEERNHTFKSHPS